MSIPGDQAEAYEKSRGECSEKFRTHEIVDLADQPDEFWADYYAQELEVADCLRGLGYDISQAPSLEAFRTGVLTEDPWSPYGELPDLGSSRWDEVNQKCPQAAAR